MVVSAETVGLAMLLLPSPRASGERRLDNLCPAAALVYHGGYPRNGLVPMVGGPVSAEGTQLVLTPPVDAVYYTVGLEMRWPAFPPGRRWTGRVPMPTGMVVDAPYQLWMIPADGAPRHGVPPEVWLEREEDHLPPSPARVTRVYSSVVSPTSSPMVFVSLAAMRDPGPSPHPGWYELDVETEAGWVLSAGVLDPVAVSRDEEVVMLGAGVACAPPELDFREAGPWHVRISPVDRAGNRGVGVELFLRRERGAIVCTSPQPTWGCGWE